LITLPLSLLAPAMHGYTTMTCRMTGAISVANCAAPAGPAAADEHQAASEPDRWVEESCCDFGQVTFTRAPAEATSRFDHLAPVSVPTIDVAIRVTWTAPRATRGAPAQPGLGPPRRLVTQTFLI
jgi:hypothetical protein